MQSAKHRKIFDEGIGNYLSGIYWRGGVKTFGFNASSNQQGFRKSTDTMEGILFMAYVKSDAFLHAISQRSFSLRSYPTM